MDWVEENKGDRPFAAGALAYIQGRGFTYGCHFGMRSTRAWAIHEFEMGWRSAWQDDPQRHIPAEARLDDTHSRHF